MKINRTKSRNPVGKNLLLVIDVAPEASAERRRRFGRRQAAEVVQLQRPPEAAQQQPVQPEESQFRRQIRPKLNTEKPSKTQ